MSLLLALALCAAPVQAGEVAGDGSGTQQLPPHARADILEAMRADVAAPRHPSDGGGRAWVVEGESTERAVVGEPGHWTLVYEVGPEGLSEGAVVFLQVSPFWGWSTPQSREPRALGYTIVTTEAEGVELSVVDGGGQDQPLSARIEGRGMRPGEQLRIRYGAGELGALPDRFAERGSRFWISVDGDGDGIRQVLADSPSVDVHAAAPAQLLLTLPTTAEPGDTVRLAVALLDRNGNVCRDQSAEVELDLPEGLARAEGQAGAVALVEGVAAVPLVVEASGIYRLHGVTGALEARSNPLAARKGIDRIVWADLQVHTGISDGTGALEDVYRYAREVAALDVVAITDHDHWGMLFLDQHAETWERIRRAANDHDVPGEFVSFVAFEWTNWVYGHRHVLYGGDDGPLLSSIDPDFDTPQELWAGLEGHDALTIAHHSAGGPVPIDWRIPPDPRFEPVTEVVSVHGSSEAADSPGGIYRPVAGHYVRDALGLGYRLGLLGSTDGHDGHPGLAHLAGTSGGVAAISCDDLTREGVFEALRARRVYATNGPRILLRFSLDDQPMGSVIPAAPSAEERGELRLVVRVVGTGPLDRIDLIHAGELADSVPCQGRRIDFLDATVPGLLPGEFVYVRVVQEDDGVAWSSPIFAE